MADHPAGPVGPRRREYAETGSRRGSVDLQERISTVGPIVILGGIGGAWGFFLGSFLLGAVLGAVIGVALVRLFVGAAARAMMEGALQPTGKSTPVKREYSRAAALAVNGQYLAAVTAYEVACAEFPDDPEPYLKIARIYRDRLDQPEEAVRWFKRARSDATMNPALARLTTQEILELWAGRLGDARRAIPDLARLADRFPGDPAAVWARAEMARLREAMIDDRPELRK